MATRPRGGLAFTREQDVLLVEFLGEVETWVAGFGWDLAEALRDGAAWCRSALARQQEEAEWGLARNPGSAVQQALCAQLEAVGAAQEALERITVAEEDTRYAFCRYTVALALGAARGRTAGRSRRADISLDVQHPSAVRINFGGDVQRPYALPEHYRGSHEKEADFAIRTQEWRTQVAPVLEDLQKWTIEPPRAEPEVVIELSPDTWHLIIAPQSEGLMASFQRLQMVRSSTDDIFPRNYGVVTDNRTLARLALDQGYLVYLSHGAR